MTLNTDTLEVTLEFLSLISELDEFKGAWQALGVLAPDRLSALRRVATIESIGSSTRIEGSRLSDQEVASLLKEIKVRKFATRDEQEVAGYAGVMTSLFRHADAMDFTENHIRQLHRDLLIYSEKDERHRGHYKTGSNHVIAFDADGNEIGLVFDTATPSATPSLMTELVTWTNNALEKHELHSLLVIAIFTVVFLEIHPFQDGNGRLSRVLSTLLLLKSGYAYVPYSSLESVIEASKESYYIALRNTQKTIRTEMPDWQPWVAYFLRALRVQKQHLKAKIEREQILIATLPELSVRILQHATAHGRLTLSQIVELTKANRNTIKKHLQSLVANRHLSQHGKGKGTWYGRI
ncbi:MAG: Fic family protein [Gammaproteobacteria bacterium]|jgi:Fic family protein|nr:Fic family protein [Gammaproteobacteria bacterium]